MATNHITRRAALGAMLIAPAVVAAPAAATTTKFAAKLAAFRAAERAERDFDQTTYAAASARYDRLEAAISHETTEWNSGPNGQPEFWSTADLLRVREARYFLDPRHTAPARPEQSGYHAACVALVAAADRRFEAIRHAEVASGFRAAGAESDRLCDLRCAARDAVIGCEVGSASELAQKMAVITEHDLWDAEESRRAITRDVANLPS